MFGPPGSLLRRASLFLVVALLVVGVVWGSAPWHKPWWPGRDEASTAPEPCTVVDLPSVRAAVGLQPEPGQDSEEKFEFHTVVSCSWSFVDDQQDPMDPAEAGLQLKYDVHRGDGGRGGGIESAQQRFASARRVALGLRDSGPDQVSDAELGDEAFALSVYQRTEVVVRHSNVVITVTLTIPKSTQGDSLADAKRIGRMAAGKLSLDA